MFTYNDIQRVVNQPYSTKNGRSMLLYARWWHVVWAQFATESTWRWSLPWLRRSVSGLSPRRPGFDPRLVHVRFVVHGVAVRQVYLQVPRSASPVSFHQYSIFIRQSLTAYIRAPATVCLARRCKCAVWWSCCARCGHQRYNIVSMIVSRWERR